MLRFVIGGVQKGGTSALAHYLGAHPLLRLPLGKEAHLFDAQDFDEGWSTAEIDARYAQAFDAAGGAVLHGDATPFYLFHPRVVARIARYNPAMRWILLLRDPVDRALSHYHMERTRGHERWPFWLALVLERRRLHGERENLTKGAPLRRYSYRARGDYAGQLDVLRRHFPQEQILLLRSEALERDPRGTVAQACSFLGVPPPDGAGDYSRVFAGDYARWPAGDWRYRLLRRWWRNEYEAQARMGIDWPRA